MATVEPVSLTIGVVALASLFSTCIECFDYFKAGQHLEEDLQVLLVKLDLEKTRLLIWGNAHGIMKADDEGRAVELSQAPKAELIGKCLERIQSLLSDTVKFQKTYGLRSSAKVEGRAGNTSDIVSANSMNIFKTSYRRFWVRFASNKSRPSLLTRTRWAIHDKAKFEGLIVHLRDLVDGLSEVLPVKRETQDQIVRDDINSILGLSKLRLVQSACEGSYRTWSALASAVIEATEIGTIDRRNIEEWMMDAEGANDDNTTPSVQAVAETVNLSQTKLFESIAGLSWHVDSGSGIYFVLTGQCPKMSMSSPCEQANLGKESAETSNSVLALWTWKEWSIGRRITDNLEPSQFTDVDLDALTNHHDDDLTDLQKIALPVAIIYIYCAPCACLIATAWEICEKAGDRAKIYFRFLIRPDDRLISSCCSETDRSVRLGKLVEDIERFETSTWTSTGYVANALLLLDKQWVEQRLFDIDELDQLPPSSDIPDMARGIFASHKSPGPTAAIIVLGELDYCLPIMHAPPFSRKPRIPKETEIFQMQRTWENGGYTYRRRYLGKYTPKPLLPSSTSPRRSVPGVSSRNFNMETSPPTISTPLNPPHLTTRHISPPPSPAAKRQKSSAGSLIALEDMAEVPADKMNLENMLTTDIVETSDA